MRRGTLHRGLAAAIAAVLLVAWLLLRGGGPAPAPRPPRDGPRAAAPAAPPPPDAPPAPAAPAAAPAPDPLFASGGTPPLAEPAAPAGRRVVLEGKVLGLGDEPVAGATVVLLLPGAQVVVAQDQFIPDAVSGCENVFALMGEEAKSAEDGSFRLDVPARPRVGLIAWGGAYANTIVEPFSLEEDRRGLVLRMEPAVALSGRVMEAALPDLGRAPGPIAGASVSLFRRGPDLRRIHLRTEETDEEGRFRTWGWTPGKYEVSVTKPGFVERRWQEVVLPTDTLDVRLVPAKTCAATGRVFLPDGSTPAAGVTVRAEVSVGPGWTDEGLEGTTGPDGRYRIEGLAVSTTPAKGALRVDADGGDRGRGRVVLHAWSGETDANVELVAAPTSVLRLRVVDGRRGEGRPLLKGVRLLARASLPAPGAPQHPLEIRREGTTDASGVVEFRGLPARHVLVGPADDEWGWEVERGGVRGVPDAPAEGPWEEEIEVFPRGRIGGIVLGPTGEPVPGARVEVRESLGQRLSAGAALCGEDGKFRVDAVSGQVPVALRATAAGFVAVHSPQVTVVPGSSVEGMVLALPAALGVLSGRVIDEAGKPRPEVRVRAKPAPRSRAQAPADVWTGSGGHFRIEVPGGGEWMLEIASEGFDPATTAAILPGEPVPDLVLRPADGPK